MRTANTLRNPRVAVFPNDSSVLLLLAQAAAGAGRIDEALRLQERLAESTAAAPGGLDGNDVPTWARFWTSVRLASLRNDARAKKDTALLDRLAARGRSDGILDLEQRPPRRAHLVAPRRAPRVWATMPGDKLPQRDSPVRGGAVGIEALRLARQAQGKEYQLAVQRAPRRASIGCAASTPSCGSCGPRRAMARSSSAFRCASPPMWSRSNSRCAAAK